ncbi:MAG: BspA family leucine-rich repeat surface protein, partial [Bacteroidetes bacterium]
MKTKLLFLFLYWITTFSFMAYSQSTGDYRTTRNATFASATGWQRYDGSTWVSAVSAPTSTDGIITISANSAANVTANISLDQIVVQGFLNVNASITLTLLDGAGDEITVSGVGAVYNRGTINNCAGGTLSPANLFTSDAWASPKGTYISPDVSEPTTETTLLYFNQSNTTAHIYWQKSGSGKRRLVVLKPTTAVNVNALTDGTTYTANAAYGSGTAVDGGFVVFDGVGGQVNVTGLTNATTYHIAVFEYNSDCSNASPNYKMGSPASANFLTGIRPFITTWRTTTASETINIPLPPLTTYTCRVDWGDGTFNRYNTSTPTMSHVYTTIGTYTVTIGVNDVTGTLVFPQILINNNATHRGKIRSIAQWGSVAWTSMASAFRGCNNLTYTATDNPNLSGVTSMISMFEGCTNFNGNIGSWNTSAVTFMQGTFQNATNFNGNIDTWNTSAVTTMQLMFWSCSMFNGNIGTWNTSAVTTMSSMFQSAAAFNGNIGLWNTSAVTT